MNALGKLPRKIAIVAAMVLGAGGLRLPLEHRLDAERRAAGLRNEGTQLSLREQASQSALLAVLGGLRSLVATVLDIEAHEAWEKTNYGEVEKDYLFIQKLQPRIFYYWDAGQSMMAYNAAAYFRYTDRERAGLNDVLSDSYVEKGRAMLIDGARYLPDNYRIHQALAFLDEHAARPPNYAESADAWRRASECPDPPGYCRRMRAYALSHVSGREADAQALIEELYNEGDRNQTPTLLSLREIFALCPRAAQSADPARVYQRLRKLHDDSTPSRIPLLMRTLRELESQLNVPPERRVNSP